MYQTNRFKSLQFENMKSLMWNGGAKNFEKTLDCGTTFFAAYGGAVWRSRDICTGDTLMCQIDGPFRN